MTNWINECMIEYMREKIDCMNDYLIKWLFNWYNEWLINVCNDLLRVYKVDNRRNGVIYFFY